MDERERDVKERAILGGGYRDRVCSYDGEDAVQGLNAREFAPTQSVQEEFMHVIKKSQHEAELLNALYAALPRKLEGRAAQGLAILLNAYRKQTY